MLGDVNISAILDSFSVSYDKRVRPNYGGEYQPQLVYVVFPPFSALDQYATRDVVGRKKKEITIVLNWNNHRTQIRPDWTIVRLSLIEKKFQNKQTNKKVWKYRRERNRARIISRDTKICCAIIETSKKKRYLYTHETNSQRFASERCIVTIFKILSKFEISARIRLLEKTKRNPCDFEDAPRKYRPAIFDASHRHYKSSHYLNRDIVSINIDPTRNDAYTVSLQVIEL